MCAQVWHNIGDKTMWGGSIAYLMFVQFWKPMSISYMFPLPVSLRWLIYFVATGPLIFEECIIFSGFAYCKNAVLDLPSFNNFCTFGLFGRK